MTTITLPLDHLSDSSLDALVNLLDKEATTMGSLAVRSPGVIKATGHLEHMLFLAVSEQQCRKKADDTLALTMIQICLAGAGISPSNPQRVPHD